jgi:hypothetical protein
MAFTDNPILMVLMIFIGMIAFAMTMVTIMGYRTNSVSILRTLRVPFFRVWIVQEGLDVKKYTIKVKELVEGKVGQKMFHRKVAGKNREYILSDENMLREGNEPLRIYFWDNSYPVTFKQFIEKRVIIGGLTYEVQPVFMTTRKAAMDSEELFEAVHNKTVRMMFKIPNDPIKFLTFMFAIGALVASAGLYTQIIEIKDGMAYDNQILENIARDQHVDIPDVKPRMFAQTNTQQQVKSP